MRPRFLPRFVAFAACAFSILDGHGAPEPAADPLATLRREHPRLLVSDDTWPVLRERYRSDPDFRSVADAEIADARKRVSSPAPTRQMEGRRLLHVSRQVMADAASLTIAYRITGERAFLETAERNLLAAAAFSDWNPSHFLDVAEMTAALAIGYDWLHAELSPDARAALRAAIVEKGLRPGLHSIGQKHGWHFSRNNWNQVCLGGLTLGALAIADEEPQLAREILEALRKHHAPGLLAYEPDGVYPEGPNYWRYGTSYTALTLAALKTALGSEDLMSVKESFFASARAHTLTLAPSGQCYSFADSVQRPEPDPLLFWFAHRLDDPSLLAGQRVLHSPYKPELVTAETIRFRFLSIIYWQTPPRASATGWTAWHGRGHVPLAIFRGPDTERGAFYLGVKGGAPSDSHAHMDAGSFLLELDGVRWADDLGMQSYHALEQRGIRLFDGSPGGDRWRIFRYTNLAHSTLTIDGALHAVEGRAMLRDFSSATSERGVTVDLTPALAPAVRDAWRRFSPRSDGLGLTIEDHISGLRSGAKVRWALVTPAEVELGENTALLRKGGRELRIRLSTSVSTPLILSIAPASGPEEFDAPAPGHRLLLAEFEAPDAVEVVLTADFSAAAP